MPAMLAAFRNPPKNDVTAGARSIGLEQCAKKWAPVFRKKIATTKESRGDCDSTESQSPREQAFDPSTNDVAAQSIAQTHAACFGAVGRSVL
ncbi:hypothetical protein [uncultured Rhodoblastus sp.]|uniref:hypothetical protein n=1 Tax=uncultured Rhodoblastus sp. TaxID=543037 RepID=UPI0025D798BF|nr:hypothetical protein [uncultured Rhodoblastus sp.]